METRNFIVIFVVFLACLLCFARPKMSEKEKKYSKIPLYAVLVEDEALKKIKNVRLSKR